MSKELTNTDEGEFTGAEHEINELLADIGTTGEWTEFAKDIKALPKHGVFFRWPAEADFEWVHPEDRGLIESLIPGSRIFCRDVCENSNDRDEGYFRIQYGGIKIRVKPSMWLPVVHQGIEIGDRIEVKSNHGKHTPVIGNIHDIEYDPIGRCTIYFISVNGIALKKKFFKEDLRPCRRLEQPLSSREIEMLNQQHY